MKAVALGLVAALAMGNAAFAAEKVPAPKCDNLAKVKAEFAKDPELKAAKFTPLTDGQWHFVEGIFAASEITPSGLPPGNGAILIQAKNKGSILWVRGKDVRHHSVASA